MKNKIMGIVIAVVFVILSSTKVSAKNINVTGSDLWTTVNYEPGVYTNAQGMCMDDKYVYVARLNNSNDSTKIYKIEKSTGKKVAERAYKDLENGLGHANDMTYCPDNNRIYVAAWGGTCKYSVVEIKPSDLSITKRYTTSQFQNMTARASGIAYDSINKVFYIKNGDKIFVYGYDKNGKTIQSSQCIDQFGLDYGSYSNYTKQGIEAYDGLLFTPLWNESVNKQKSVVRIYDIKKTKQNDKVKYNASYRRTDTYCNKNRDKFEMESIAFSSKGKMYFMTNGSTKSKPKNSYDEVFKVSFTK